MRLLQYLFIAAGDVTLAIADRLDRIGTNEPRSFFLNMWEWFWTQFPESWAE